MPPASTNNTVTGSSNRRSKRTSSSSSTTAATATAASQKTQHEQEQEQLVSDGLKALAALAAAGLLLKAIAASITLYIALIPLVYLYGVQTCPPASSFDAKQQLRTVLSGENLPDDHPEHTKSGTFAGLFAQAKAAITTELATLPGYTVDIATLGGAACFATVTMPTADRECYWVGCNHRWYYWGTKKLSETATAGVSDNRAGKNVYQAPESAKIKIGATNISVNFKAD